MLETRGTVVSIDGEYAVVRMDEVGCGRCHEEGGCGGNSLGKMFCSQPQSYRVLNPGHSQVGDVVTVIIAEGVIQRSAVRAYLFPLAAMLAGAFFGHFFINEIGAIVGSVVGLLSAWMILRRLQPRYHNTDHSQQPYIKH